jgi:hypothetical protein
LIIGLIGPIPPRRHRLPGSGEIVKLLAEFQFLYYNTSHDPGRTQVIEVDEKTLHFPEI